MATLTAADYPENFRRIEMVLAREPAHPVGDASHRYTFVIPLNDDGMLDRTAAIGNRALCRVVQRLPDEPARIGHLVARGSGSAIRYDDDGEVERGFRLEQERFVPGEYISIEEDDEMRSFRVLTVGPIA